MSRPDPHKPVVSLHVVDQAAAVVRDSGISPVALKIQATGFDALAAGLARAGRQYTEIRLSLAEVADMLQAQAVAFRQVADQVDGADL